MAKLILILVLLLALYLFAICPRIFCKPDNTPFLHVHYAHRGLFDNQTEAPENSLPAFEKACKKGYGIELDVQLSKDNIPVVFHDKTLKRMCGIHGNVWDYTLKELKEMRLAHSDVSIPTLEEVLKVIDGRVPLLIEYKLDRVQTTVCQLSQELLSGYNGIYCIECFHPFALAWYKKNRPDVYRGQLCREFWKDDQFRGNLPMAIVSFMISNFLARPDFIAYHYKDYKNVSLRLCKAMGADTFAWTIRSEEQFDMVKNKFDAFIFDSFELKLETASGF